MVKQIIKLSLLIGGYMYSIADFNIDIRNHYNMLQDLYREYFVDSNEKEAVITCTDEEIENERNADMQFSNAYLEGIAVFRKLAEWLPLNNAFVLHSACFDVDGVGVAFAAHSGTGKTTHMRLWQQLLGDKMTVVNGDKPIVRFFDNDPNTPYAYGTPWNGKERLGCNTRTKLQHICFIERSETNFVEKVNKKDAVNLILNQVYMPKDPMALMNTMQLIDRLLSSCSLWIIHCNMEPEAAKIAYEAILNNKE